MLDDSPQNFNGYVPHDFDNGGMGPISARAALVYSRNIPAVEVGQMEGMTNVINLAHEMGIQSHLDPGLATAIGGRDLTPKEHGLGHQGFAHHGQKIKRKVIQSIPDSDRQTVS